MTLRNLPALSAQKVTPGASWELPERARASWDRRVSAAAGDTTITILDVIGEDFWGDGVSPNRIYAALRSIGNQPVTVQINSPGGVFDDGLAIYNMLRMHPAKVTTQVIGMAASAASIIAMAGDEIQIAKAGHMMIHNTQWVAFGDRHAMLAAHDAMAKFDETLAGLYIDRTGLDEKDVRAIMDGETFMTGSEAVDRGFADGLLEADITHSDAASNRSPLAEIEAALANGKALPRSERRRLIKNFVDSKPRAAGDDAMPGAGEEADGLAHLRIAAMKLSLNRG
ncbi:head maturation protease, ClpP-related [Sphingobium yanoikuyae]|jgi:ATP-dependent Clp protease, protease subunit|uniref:head maturation protease, ClpP-related n=1 Tax=Sphingobium yanoikuyae TaxID=13690 RepID=UPI003B8FA530